MVKRTKIIKTYSIDKEEFELFKKNCEDHCLNISRFISNKIKEWNEIVEKENSELPENNKLKNKRN